MLNKIEEVVYKIVKDSTKSITVADPINVVEQTQHNQNLTVTSETTKAPRTVDIMGSTSNSSAGHGLVGTMHMILQCMYVSKRLLTDENLRSLCINTLNYLSKKCEPDGLLPV